MTSLDNSQIIDDKKFTYEDMYENIINKHICLIIHLFIKYDIMISN